MKKKNKQKATAPKRRLIVTDYFQASGKTAQSVIESYILREASNLL